MPEAMITKQQVLEALGRVAYPGFQRDIVSMGMVQDIEVRGGTVTFRLAAGSSNPDAHARLQQACREAIGRIPGVEELRMEVEGPPPGQRGAAAGPPGAGPAGPAQAQPIPGVAAVVAVASGKGGVGKSTVAVNISAALAARGRRVGLLDADIYGPSVPTMLGIREGAAPDGNRMRPVERHAIHAISIGFFVEPERAVIWRGPMVMKAVRQFLQDTDWGDLDCLVVDLPPGTGDAQLTLVQLVPLDGAIVVTTPQEVALTDARKAVSMFRTTHCPVLGIVENMSHFVCPSCGTETDIFSRGGGRAEADRLGVPFLGEVPIAPALRESGDAGTPLVVSDPESAASRAFLEIADRVLGTLEGRRG